MKQITIALLLLCSISAFAAEPVKVLKDKFPDYEGVINCEGKKAIEIQRTLREWVAINFKSAQDVVQMDDENSSTIIVKGAHDFNTQAASIVVANTLDFTLDLRFKDNRFKYKITITDVKTGIQKVTAMNDVMLKEVPVKPNGKPYKGMMLKSVNKNKEKMLVEIREFKKSLIDRLNSINTSSKNNDW